MRLKDAGWILEVSEELVFMELISMSDVDVHEIVLNKKGVLCQIVTKSVKN